MPKIVVEGPDGKKYAFPDTMPREQINTFMKERYGTKARNETVNDYLARVVREQDATKARAKSVTKEATAAGRAEGERAAERMGVNNAFEMAMAAPAIGMAQQAGARRVFNKEGTMLPDEAAGLAALNTAGFFIPGMVNQRFGQRVEEGRRQQPGAALAGDVAGGMIGGELIGLGLQKAGQAIAPGVSAIGRMFKGKPAAASAAAAEPPMVLGPQNRILPVDRPDALPGDDVEMARALDAWTPPVEQQVRPMGFFGGKKPERPLTLGPQDEVLDLTQQVYPEDARAAANAQRQTVGNNDIDARTRMQIIRDRAATSRLEAVAKVENTLQSARADIEGVPIKRSAERAEWDAAVRDATRSINREYGQQYADLGNTFTVSSRGSNDYRTTLAEELASMMLRSKGIDPTAVKQAALKPRGTNAQWADKKARRAKAAEEEEARRAAMTEDDYDLMNFEDTTPDISVQEFLDKAVTEQRLNMTADEMSAADVIDLAERYARAFARKGGKNVTELERIGNTIYTSIRGPVKPNSILTERGRDAVEQTFGAAYMSGTGSVAGGQYDLNGDGEIDNTDRAIGSGIGLAAFASPLALRKAAELGARMKGKR